MLRLASKKYFAIIVVLVFFSLTTVSFGQEAVKGIVIGDNVNVRDEANIESTVVTQLKIGQYVGIVDIHDEWFNIESEDGLAGWIYSDLIIPVNPETDLSNKWVVSAENVNVRENPDLDSTIISQLQKENEIVVLEKSMEWYQISYKDNLTGWVHSNFIKPKLWYSKGKVIGSNVNLRSIPSLEGGAVTQLNLNENVTIKNFDGGWYNVSTSKDVEGWVHQDYVRIVTSGSNQSEISRSSNRSATQLKIVDFAKKYLGTPYKWAGNGPNSFDCSGYTTYVFKHFGVSLPRRSSDQGNTGDRIEKESLSVGDLVFFDTSGANNGDITHVGIYIGDGQFIHASSGSSAKKVTISNLNEGYYNEKYVVARRVF